MAPSLRCCPPIGLHASLIEPGKFKYNRQDGAPTLGEGKGGFLMLCSAKAGPAILGLACLHDVIVTAMGPGQEGWSFLV